MQRLKRASKEQRGNSALRIAKTTLGEQKLYVHRIPQIKFNGILVPWEPESGELYTAYPSLNLAQRAITSSNNFHLLTDNDGVMLQRDFEYFTKCLYHRTSKSINDNYSMRYRAHNEVDIITGKRLITEPTFGIKSGEKSIFRAEYEAQDRRWSQQNNFGIHHSFSCIKHKHTLPTELMGMRPADIESDAIAFVSRAGFSGIDNTTDSKGIGISILKDLSKDACAFVNPKHLFNGNAQIDGARLELEFEVVNALSPREHIEDDELIEIITGSVQSSEEALAKAEIPNKSAIPYDKVRHCRNVIRSLYADQFNGESGIRAADMALSSIARRTMVRIADSLPSPNDLHAGNMPTDQQFLFAIEQAQLREPILLAA